MDEYNYWKRLAGKRLSRRRLLGGAAAAGAGLTALSLVGCDSGGNGGGGTTTPAVTATPVGTATPGGATGLESIFVPEISPRPPWEPATARGGVARWFGFDALPPDTYDPHQTQLGPIYGMHSAVFSKVLMYDDIYELRMVTDLAETIPETADKLTYIVKIRPNVRFHDTEKFRKQFPNTAGRQLTAEDVKYSIERQVNRDSPRSSLYYRSFQWDTLDRIEMPDGPDGLTLKFVTKRPTAAFVHYLGDTNAFIIAKELVDVDRDDMNSLDKMIGTGPFYLDRFVALQASRCARNSDWFAKDDLVDQGLSNRPIVDAIEAIWPPQDDTSTEVAFSSKQVDNAFYVDSNNAERIVREMGVDRTRNVNTGWVNSRLLVADSEKAASPFKDLRVRKALHLAVDRSAMGQQMFGGPFFAVCPPISLSLTQWAYTPEELAKKPGYRFRREEREEDLVEAKLLWEAGGGADLGEVELLVAGIPDYVKNQGSQLQRRLSEVLGLKVKVRIDASGYTEIAQAALEKRAVFSLNFDNGWIDPDDWLYAYFHSTSPKNSFNLSDPTLDQMLEKQRAEFDVDTRRQVVLEIQDYLLENVVAKLDYVAPSTPNTKWPYMRNRRQTPWFGDWYLWPPNVWLDSADPTYEGRPA